MPNPSKYKDKQDFMDDCMHQTRKVEGKPQAQSVAMCLSMWRDKGKKKKRASDALRCAAAALMGAPGQQTDGNPGASHHYIVSMYRSGWSEEDKEIGDTDRKETVIDSEKFDSIEDLATDRRVRNLLWDGWEPETVRGGSNEWIYDRYEPGTRDDFEKGIEKAHTLHVKRSDGKNLSKSEVDGLSDLLKVRKKPIYAGEGK